MNATTYDFRAVITPLRLIFWGGLLCVLDLNFSQTVNGEGWSVDLLNDLVGMLMISYAVHRLASASPTPSYIGKMRFVFFASVLGCLNALHNHFIYDTPVPIMVLSTLVSLAVLAGVLVFCLAMRQLCLEAVLPRSYASWGVTMALFIVIYVAPLGLFYLAALFALITESSFNIDLGPAGLLLIPLFLAPLIHLFVSTSRMRAEASSQVA